MVIFASLMFLHLIFQSKHWGEVLAHLRMQRLIAFGRGRQMIYEATYERSVRLGSVNQARSTRNLV